MPWTTPRTWTDGELVTKSIMDTHIRDNLNAVGPHLIVRKPSDETDSTGTVQNDDHLLLALTANEIWQFRFNLLVVAAGTTDFVVRLTFPSGSISAMGYGGDAFLGEDFSSVTSPTGSVAFSTQGTVSHHIVLEGVISNGGSAGNLQIQWSGNTAAACTVKANSTLWAVKLA